MSPLEYVDLVCAAFLIALVVVGAILLILPRIKCFFTGHKDSGEWCVKGDVHYFHCAKCESLQKVRWYGK